MKTDVFRIEYDDGKVSPPAMLRTIRKLGFDGTIVAEPGSSPGTPGPATTKRDLAHLPKDLGVRVREAAQRGSPLLLTFHGLG